MDKPEVKRKSAVRETIEWIITLALAVALALAVHRWVGQLVIVQGESMQPTLLNNERVLLGRLEYYGTAPKRGDIVVVKYPDVTEDIIKRVIATAGETIEVHDGSVYINGTKLDEPYIQDPIADTTAPTVVPEGTVFVMGDNRNDSLDSRSVGPIALDQVLGRAYAVVWPADKLKKLTAYQGGMLN